MNHLSEEQLIEYCSGDAADARGIEQHLRECAECRRTCETLERVLAAAREMPVPEPHAAYEARLWQHIAPHLEGSQPRFDWRGWLAPRRLVPAGAVAALIVLLMGAAFFAGLYWPGRHGTAPVEAVAPQARERILLVAVGDHLERAQMVLLEISNTEPPPGTDHKAGEVDISSERQRAEELLAFNRLYRQTATRTGDAGVAGVLDELEPVLVEIANSPSKVSPATLQELRRRIEARGLLLKVRVLGSTVRGRERRAIRGETPYKSS